MTNIAIEAMAIEIVDFPIEHGGSFHSYVKLPEGSQLRPGESLLQMIPSKLQLC